MKRKTMWAAVLVLCALLLAGVLDSQQQALSGKLIRLHVVGGTNLPEDQALKLTVKDAVTAELSEMLSEAGSKEEAEDILRARLDFITETAIQAADEAGRAVSVKSELKTEPFPTKGYDTFALPAGYYTALRVTIDEGEGANWWCVVYPQVCSAEVTEREDFQQFDFSAGEIDLITRNGEGYVVKFRLLELIEKLKIAIFG